MKESTIPTPHKFLRVHKVVASHLAGATPIRPSLRDLDFLPMPSFYHKVVPTGLIYLPVSWF